MTREIEELLEKVHNMNSYDTYSRLYDEILSLEQQLANLKHNYEMQEIMIADYKKRIAELELRLSLSDSALDEYKQQVAYLEAPKSCELCVHRIEPNRGFPSFSCSILQRHIRNDFFCADYELMDNQ